MVILFCLLAGILMRSLGRLPPQGYRTLNVFILHAPLPALVLVKMHALFRGEGVAVSPSDLWLPVSMAWIQFVLAWGFGGWLGRRLKLSRATTGALVLTAGLGNTSFVGFPLLELIYGKAALEIGVLVDQPGTFLVFSTLGVLTALVYSGNRVKPAQIARRMFTFPSMIALILAVLLIPFRFPVALTAALDAISASLIPAALVSVGAQLQWNPAALRRRLPALASGLIFKLVLLPMLFIAFYLLALGQRGFVAQVTVVESAMAPMISAVILAEEAGLDSELAGLMLGIGIPLSFLTVPVWSWLLRGF